jgi:hypothetical protein
MNTIREWLKANKIIFETIAAFLLSLMALTLTCQSNRIAGIQAKLAARQTAIADAQNQPFFRASLMIHWDSTQKRFDEDRLAIINDGAPANNPTADLAHFLSVRCPSADRDSMIPLLHYYDYSIITGRRTDTLWIFQGRKNREVFSQLYRSYLAVDSSGRWPSWIGQRLFLSMRYLDRTGQPHVTFYEVTEPGGSILLDSTTGAGLFRILESKSTGRYIDLSNATVDSVNRVCRGKPPY